MNKTYHYGGKVYQIKEDCDNQIKIDEDKFNTLPKIAQDKIIMNLALGLNKFERKVLRCLYENTHNKRK